MCRVILKNKSENGTLQSNLSNVYVYKYFENIFRRIRWKQSQRGKAGVQR